jgi:hypothetical protein
MQIKKKNAGLEVPTAVAMNSTVVWVAAPVVSKEHIASKFRVEK